MLNVYIMNVSEIGEMSEYSRFLSDKRAEKTARYLTDTARRQSIGVELLLGYAMCANGYSSKIPIRYDYLKNGKPYIADSHTHISLAHSGNVAVCAVSDKPVGVDVEVKRNIHVDINAKVLSTSEQSEYMHICPDNRCTYITRRWTAKEAYLKLTGEGLNFPMPRIELGDGKIKSRNGSVLAHVDAASFTSPDCYVCVAHEVYDDTAQFFTVTTAEVIKCLEKIYAAMDNR